MSKDGINKWACPKCGSYSHSWSKVYLEKKCKLMLLENVFLANCKKKDSIVTVDTGK